mmetsp:Transcript_48078/g.114259  ORF Transcript_48078/g.114259 Transcript_48078/m.114259 type:complete len:493 (+) Transcript_48078:81-1559(+)
MCGKALVAVLCGLALVGRAVSIREELFAASGLAACEARNEQLEHDIAELRSTVAKQREQIAHLRSGVSVPAAADWKTPAARSLAQLAAEEGELIVPSADVMKVLGDVSSQLAVKKQEAAVEEQAARIAKVMAQQAAEEQQAASVEKDDKEKEFQRLLEEYEKAEEAAKKELEGASQQMEEAKEKQLQVIAEADSRLNEAEKSVKHASGTLKLSTTTLNSKQPVLNDQIKKATQELKDLVSQQTQDEAKLAEAKTIRDALTEELQKTKDDHDAKTQDALDQLSSVEAEWIKNIEVLSDKVDEAERKLSEASASETATRSVSSKLELMKAEKEKAHKKAQMALQLYTMGTDEMKVYQANVDKVFGWVTNCERKWFKGKLRTQLMESDSITAEEVSKASRLQKPRNQKDEEEVIAVMKDYFSHLSALKRDTHIFGSNFPNFSMPMATTFAAVESETMKLANMACKYWAVTKGGEASTSNAAACQLFMEKECGGKC